MAESVAETSTLERELRSLSGAAGHDCPKTLITLDDVRQVSYDGITQIYALDWLKGV